MAPTSLEWLNRMYPALTGRSDGMRAMDAFYTGDHPLPFLTPAHADKMRSQFRQMLDESRSNFMRLIVDVVAERLAVEGFRLSADSDAATDKKSWDIWQANHLDTLSKVAFVESLVKGVSYMSVWPDQDDDGFADICVEDPLETIISYTPGTNFRRRDAALKVWCDPYAQMEYATVYLPASVNKFQRDMKDAPVATGTLQSQRLGSVPPQWVTRTDTEPVVANPLNIVPIVPLRNRPRLLTEGESELSDVFRVQNQINSFLFLLMLAGYFGGHRQRYATGITLMEDEQTGQVKEPFDVAIDKLWLDENPEAKFGEFTQTDLSGFIAAIEQKVVHLAITSRTPKHYLLQSGQEPSGDAIKSAESGLVKKLEDKQHSFGEALEEVMVLARAAQQKNPTGVKPIVDSETVWADPATESQAVNTDAVIKKFAAGLIPAEQALEDLGYSQTTISRIMAQRQGDALLAGLLTPGAPAAVPSDGSAAAPAGPPVAAAVTDKRGDLAIMPEPAIVKPLTIKP